MTPLPSQVRHRTVAVGDVDVFYREAGPADAPAVLLLHGYPSSSHMFRDLIPALAERYRVVAPDLPGFGSTVAPPRGEYPYTFAALTETTAGFTDAVGLDRYALYVFDYGGPVGFRLAAMRPERVTAIVSQNGNAYTDGLLDAWDPVRTYWEDPTDEHRDALRKLHRRDLTEWQYHHGVPEPLLELVGPDGIEHDQAILDRDDSPEVQLDLIGDYRTNVEAYPEWQAYFREHRPPLLAVWGQGDGFFGPAGAEAFRRDLPDAEVHLLDTGHFALETHAPEIAALTLDFLGRTLGDATPDSAIEAGGADTRLERVLGVPVAADAVRQWPQSGEAVVGRDRIGDVEGGFEGFRLGVGRRISMGDTLVVEWTGDYGDGRLYRNVTVADIEDGVAVRATDYWGEPFDPPAGRAHLVSELAMGEGTPWPAADALVGDG